MADVHHIISLGIGSPADIEHFLLVGLSIGEAAAVTEATADWVIQCGADVSTIHCRPDANPAVRDEVTTIRVRPDVATIQVQPDEDEIAL